MPSITFMIGNGFDLNLGLKTSYKDFIKHYMDVDSGNDQTIKDFKSDISKDLETWADVEKELGKYTKVYDASEIGINKFFNCHTDISEKLIDYLKNEESKIKRESLDEIKVSLINLMNNFMKGFRPDQRKAIDNSLKLNDGPYRYYFIVFNYTEIIDRCLANIEDIQSKLNKRSFRGNQYTSIVNSPIHIHGNLNGDVIFGVNDESQIDNIQLFENNNPIYKKQFIKQLANQNNGYGKDNLANDILNSSDLIYLYGLSIGDTDAIWWNRISTLLVNKPNLHIIIYKYPVPQRGVTGTSFYLEEDIIRRRLISFGSLEPKIVEDIIQRIHIDEVNKLSDVEEIADNKKYETMKNMKELAKARVENSQR